MARLDTLHGVTRVLDPKVVPSLADYQNIGGGDALVAARSVPQDTLIALISDSGLRGRGGGGFPTGLKWKTVAESESAAEPTTVVVNAAEGEPGTFKDRALLRRNPYRMLEGAAIAAYAVGATRTRIGIKASFVREVRVLDNAISETIEAGWFDDIDVAIVLGAGYLFGEETAMLEVIEGRQPFPRVAPPFRRGLDEDDPTRSSAGLDMAAIGGSTEPPALVNNVETLSNVPLIVNNGAEWFRSLGTEKSPGTVVVTITGDTNRAGVAEVPMGTPLSQAIDLIGWGVRMGRSAGVIISGTANPLIPGAEVNLRLSYEDMAAAGYGLGSAGFIVFDDHADPVAVAQGISHFLAVESCGQCEACKLDGTELSNLLRRLSASEASADEVAEIRRRQSTVSNGARCNLARQQEAVVGSLLGEFSSFVDGHQMEGPAAELPPAHDIPLIAPLEDIVGGTATIDTAQAHKQLDWSYEDIDSGTMPASRFGNTPFFIGTPIVHERETIWPTATPGDRIHPLEQVDHVHNELDALLHDLLHGDAAQHERAANALTHLMRVHVDVTQRVLYPTVRRHCGADGDELADHALDIENVLMAAVDGLDSKLTSDDAVVDAVQQIGLYLHRHATDEDQMFEMLSGTLDEQEKKVLLNALTEANATSLA